MILKSPIFLLIYLIVGCTSDIERRDRFFLLGNEALENELFEKAIKCYNQALKIDSKHTKVLNNRGVARMEQDHPHEAILDYNQAILQDSGYLDALFNRAFAYEQTGKFDKALKDVETIHRLIPDSAFVHFYWGLVLTKIKDYGPALEHLLKADSLDPLNPGTIINMATIHYFLQDFDKAGDVVGRAMELNPKDPDALNLMSLIESEKKNYLSALAEINRALDEVPDEPHFLNNRGHIYLEMDSLDRAIEDINRSIVLNPKNGWAYRNKGIFFSKKQDFKQAIRLFERAVQSSDFIDEIYFYLGEAHRRAGDMEKACQAWKEGSEFNEEPSKQALISYCNSG